MAFDVTKVEELYPEAGPLMWEPMLMWKLPTNKRSQLTDICASGDYFASIKKDGSCYQFVKTPHFSYLFGRTVSRTTNLLTEKISNIPHIKSALDCLPSNTVLVVEIYYPGGTSKSVTPIMGALPNLAIKRQENNPIHAYIHDILYYDSVDLRNTGALDRYKILAAVWSKYELSRFSFLELAQPIFDDIYEIGMLALRNGEEGLVLRKKDGKWYPGQRPAWNTIKMKKMDSVDLVCVGVCDATVEYTGKLDIGPNYTGTEVDQWPYWCIFTTGFQLDNGILSKDHVKVRYERVDIGDKKVIKSPEFVTLPVTKGYYYGWKTAIEIGGYDENDQLVKIGTVSSGLTDEDCQNMAAHPENYIGHVFEFECMEKDNKERTLRHPALIGRRDDKDAKDCKIKEIFS